MRRTAYSHNPADYATNYSPLFLACKMARRAPAQVVRSLLTFCVWTGLLVCGSIGA